MSFLFSKLHGLGNDFFVVDCRTPTGAQDSSREPTAETAVRVCDRYAGVTVLTDAGPITGADGILLIKRPHDARAYARMEILNADGSTAEMCGNGIRVVALFLKRMDPAFPETCEIETLAGMIGVATRGYDELGGEFEVDMGVPRLGDVDEVLEAMRGHKLTRYTFRAVDMGNPHAVIFEQPKGVDGQGFSDLDALRLQEIGEPIELHARFANRTNVEFVRVESREHLRVRVWERGSGETLACGTGACAAAVVGILRGEVASPVRVTLPGGDLMIEWAGAGSAGGAGAALGAHGAHVKMTGPAEFTGEGVFEV